MQTEERNYLQGANAGHVLAQYAPEIIEILNLNSLNLPGYFAGLVFGAKEYCLNREALELQQLAEIRGKGKSLEREG